MNALRDKDNFRIQHPSRTVRVSRDAFVLLIRCACFPLLAILLIVEPIIRVALSAVALASLLTACFFVFFTDVPNSPLLGMIGLAVACVALLKAYYAALRLLL